MRVLIANDEKDMAQVLKEGLEEEIACQRGLRWYQWAGSGAGALLRHQGVSFTVSDEHPDHYRLPTKVLTALGGRTPGHFGRQKKGRGGQSAEMRIYTIQE